MVQRVGREASPTRSKIVGAAARLIVDEGHGSVNFRSVAKAIGVDAPLVRYYFPSIDELFVAVIRQWTAKRSDQLAKAATSQDPLRRLWKVHRDHRSARMLSELMAVAHHRRGVCRVFVELIDQSRQTEIAAIERAVIDGRLDLRGSAPAAVQVLLSTSAHGFVAEKSIGMRSAHPEFEVLIETLLERSRTDTPRPSPRG